MRMVSILGDSISTYEGFNPEGYSVFYNKEMIEKNGMHTVDDTWWAKVIQYLNAHLCVNNSYSGSKVTGGGFPSAICEERLSNLHMDTCNPEIILVYIGFNDFGNGVKIKRPWLFKSNDFCFQDAYNKMISKIKMFYPKSSIICGTLLRTKIKGYENWKFPEYYAGVEFEDYNNAIITACKSKSAFLADLSKSNLRYETLDGSHPTVAGHETIADAWLTCLKDLGFIN